MTRYGPLHSFEGGMIVGDPGRRHLTLTPTELLYRSGSHTEDAFAWADVERVIIDVPTSRFRFPGLVSGIFFSVVMAIIADDPTNGPKPGTVTIRSESEETILPLDRHHFGGYWERGAVATQRLLDRFVDDAESRELLRHPDRLLRAVRASARR